MTITKRKERDSFEDQKIKIGGGGQIGNCLRAISAIAPTDNTIYYEDV